MICSGVRLLHQRGEDDERSESDSSQEPERVTEVKGAAPVEPVDDGDEDSQVEIELQLETDSRRGVTSESVNLIAHVTRGGAALVDNARPMRIEPSDTAGSQRVAIALSVSAAASRGNDPDSTRGPTDAPEAASEPEVETLPGGNHTGTESDTDEDVLGTTTGDESEAMLGDHHEIKVAAGVSESSEVRSAGLKRQRPSSADPEQVASGGLSDEPTTPPRPAKAKAAAGKSYSDLMVVMYP